MAELETQANIKVITVSLRVKEDLLWDRISKRLQREPERKKYREDQWDWMQQVRQFYDVAFGFLSVGRVLVVFSSEVRPHMWACTVCSGEGGLVAVGHACKLD